MSKSLKRVDDNDIIEMVNEYVDTNNPLKEIAGKKGLKPSRLSSILARLEIPRRKRRNGDWDKLKERIHRNLEI